MKPKTTDTKIQHIRLIICCNKREKAAELIMENGYAETLEGAYEIIDKEDGKR